MRITKNSPQTSPVRIKVCKLLNERISQFQLKPDLGQFLRSNESESEDP
jgi:hypothetical protein